MKLRKYLSENSSELNSRLQVIESKARDLLEYSQGGTHVTFTTHGFSHISAVESNYDWLLSDDDIRSLNPTEVFCLLCATFFHDTQMIPRRAGLEAQARSEHAKLAQDFLLKHKDLLGLSIHEAATIAQIILGHGVANLTEIQKDIVIGSALVDIRKLAACLSLADICHADSGRAPEIVFRHLDMDEESSFHWRRHLQISGITRKDSQLLMSAHHFSDEGLRAVEEYKEAIERQLTILQPYFHTVLTPLLSVELQTQKLRSQLDIALRFQANTTAILDILIEGVYQRADVFIRELVQNAIDACHLRLAKAMKRSEKYQPRVVISLLSAHNKIRGVRIDDNGIGMDVHDVQDTVLWIGNSIARRSDIKSLLNETTQKNLIANFGIGLLSCFKAATCLQVRTAKESRDPIEFTVSAITNEIKPVESKDVSIGTTFLVELKDEFAAEADLSQAAAHYFRRVLLAPIELLKLDAGNVASNYTREEIFRIATTQAKQVGILPPTNPEEAFCIHDIKGDDFLAWTWLPKTAKDTFPVEEGEVIILNEGVFVCDEDASEWLPGWLTVGKGLINFSAKAVDLPVARDKVVSNKKASAKRNEIGQKCLGLIDKLVRLTGEPNEDDADYAALLLSHFVTIVDSENKPKILQRLGNFCVRPYQRRRELRLSEVVDGRPATVYVEYSQGRWVKDLCVLDEKQLYHKPDDLTQLQAAILKQDGEIVITGKRCDKGDKRILEFNLIKAYCELNHVPVVDLTNENKVVGKLRSKPVPRNVRQEISQNVKFVEVSGLPDKRGWIVDSETWINVANPQMAFVYGLLQSDFIDADQLRLASLLIQICACRFEESAEKILEWLESDAHQDKISNEGT